MHAEASENGASVQMMPLGPPTSWREEDVQRFLKTLELEDLGKRFMEHEVTGNVLLSLTEEDLERQLGVVKFGPRRRLALAIAELRRHNVQRAISPSTRGSGGFAAMERAQVPRACFSVSSGAATPVNATSQAVDALSQSPGSLQSRAFGSSCCITPRQASPIMSRQPTPVRPLPVTPPAPPTSFVLPVRAAPVGAQQSQSTPSSALATASVSLAVLSPRGYVVTPPAPLSLTRAPLLGSTTVWTAKTAQKPPDIIRSYSPETNPSRARPQDALAAPARLARPSSAVSRASVGISRPMSIGCYGQAARAASPARSVTPTTSIEPFGSVGSMPCGSGEVVVRNAHSGSVAIVRGTTPPPSSGLLSSTSPLRHRRQGPTLVQAPMPERQASAASTASDGRRVTPRSLTPPRDAATMPSLRSLQPKAVQPRPPVTPASNADTSPAHELSPAKKPLKPFKQSVAQGATQQPAADAAAGTATYGTQPSRQAVSEVGVKVCSSILLTAETPILGDDLRLTPPPANHSTTPSKEAIGPAAVVHPQRRQPQQQSALQQRHRQRQQAPRFSFAQHQDSTVDDAADANSDVLKCALEVLKRPSEHVAGAASALAAVVAAKAAAAVVAEAEAQAERRLQVGADGLKSEGGDGQPSPQERSCANTLREIYNGCEPLSRDASGARRVDTAGLVASCRRRLRITSGVVRVARDPSLDAIELALRQLESGGSQEVTWADFWSTVCQLRAAPVAVIKAPAAQPDAQEASLESSTNVGSDALTQLPLHLGPLTEHQTSRHRSARAWVVSRALARGFAAQEAQIQTREGSQLKALAREVDTGILVVVAAQQSQDKAAVGCAGCDDAALELDRSAAHRLQFVKPYTEQLLQDALKDLAGRVEGEGVLRVKDPKQAEDAVRAYVNQVSEALSLRLSGGAAAVASSPGSSTTSEARRLTPHRGHRGPTW